MATRNNLPVTELPAMFPRFDATDKAGCVAVLEYLTTNAKQIQEAVLETILSRSAQTEYLRGFLHGQSDKLSFKLNVPLATYDDFWPYIDRIAHGKPSALLCGQSICELVRSSGTSGCQPKLLPLTEEEIERRFLLRSLSTSLYSYYLDGLQPGKEMKFHFMAPESKTASGLMARTSLTGLMKRLSPRIDSPNWDKAISSPYGVIVCQDTEQSMYCQLLCGLIQRDEAVLVTGSRIVSKILSRPNPELANAIEQECSKASWEAIVRKLWPRVKHIQAILTGSMAQYIPLLEFYGGGLPLVSPLYTSSECYFGLNLNPLCLPQDITYTIFPNLAYFEFLEVEDDDDHQTSGTKKDLQVVDLVDVKIGQCYEIVVTTFTGLYRFRMRDILRATGFYNNAPQFRFVGRKNVILSVDLETTSEEDLLKAVMHASLSLEQHGLMLMDFTSHGDNSTFPGHYVLYWELRSKFKNEIPLLDPSILEECCFMVEESLHAMYHRFRNKKTIGPLEIKVVRHGTFDELMDLLLSRGSSLNQYKTPRYITDEQALKILDSGVVSKFVSQKTPLLKFHGLHSVK